MQQILQRAGQAIKLPDHERVARPQLIEQAVQLGPVPAPTRRLVLEHPFAAGALERTDLGGGDLGVVRLGNPCIAEGHGPVSHFPVANELTLATGLCTRQALAPQPCCINVRTLLANSPDWVKAAPMRENLLASWRQFGQKQDHCPSLLNHNAKYKRPYAE